MGNVPQLKLDDFEIVFVGELWEWSMWLLLVPEANGRDVILKREISSAGTPAQSLDRYLEVFFEPDRIHNVPAIEAEALLRIVEAVRPDDPGPVRCRVS